jgi:uncharacterized protein YodC (DUF2158 family)
MSFVAGMLVRLKSGGPPMTIQAVDGDSVTCVWFDRAGAPREQIFLTVMIEGLDEVGDILKRIKEGEDV